MASSSPASVNGYMRPSSMSRMSAIEVIWRQRDGGWPVVLYSHSLGGERSETTCLVEDLASQGYVVVDSQRMRR